FLDQPYMARLADAPDLQIRPVGEFDQAVAMPCREFRYSRRLPCIDPAAARADTDHEPIAGSHRRQGPGTPALDRNAAHEPSPRAAAIELRRVFQSEASRSRRKQVSIATSAAGFSHATNERTRSLPSV